MPDCTALEVAFIDQVKAFNKAYSEANSVRWLDIGADLLGAWSGAIIGALTTRNPVGIFGGASPGLISTYKDIAKDFQDIPAVDGALDGVEDAFDALQKCRESNLTEDEEHVYSGGSEYDDFVVIPYAQPDPEVIEDEDDDEIIIFDDDDEGEIVFLDDDGDEIILLDD